MASRKIGMGEDAVKLVVTEHSFKRIKGRGNVKSFITFKKMAKRSYLEGIGFKEATGSLLEFVKSKYQNEYRANNIRIYGHLVYIWKNNVLLTVVELPQYLWKFWDNRVKECNIKEEE